MSKLDQYNNIQALVQKEATDIARKIANEVYDQRGAQYSVPTVPYHLHNGVDTPKIPAQNVESFTTLGEVITAALASGQTVNNVNTSNFTGAQIVPTLVIPIIYGFGVGGASAFNGGDATTGSVVIFTNAGTNAQIWLRLGEDVGTTRPVTAPLSGGDTSATLTAVWNGPTNIYSTTFSNGDVRNVTYTSGSASISWTGGLSGAATIVLNIAITAQWFGVNLPLIA